MSLPDPYISPQGYRIDTGEVYDDGGEGFCVLVVQHDQEADTRRCQLSASPNLATTDAEIVVDRNGWIYSHWQAPTGRRFFIHSQTTVETESEGQTEVVAEAPVALTAITGRVENELWLIGRDGYVGRLREGTIADLPIAGCSDVNEITISPEGTVYAVGENGGFFRLHGNSWTRIDLGIDTDLFGALANDDDDVLLCGAAGLCGRYHAGSIERFEAAAERNLYDVAVFQGEVYFAAGTFGVDRLTGTSVEPFKDVAYAFHLCSNDRYLYTSGLNRVGRFDGTGWLKVDYL